MTKDKTKENILRSSGAIPQRCMACGKCSASCPGHFDMDIPPHKVVNYINNNRTAEVLASKTLWACMGCFACAERCPRGVEPVNLIEAARAVVLRKQDSARLKQDDIPGIVDADDDVPQQLLVASLRKRG